MSEADEVQNPNTTFVQPQAGGAIQAPATSEPGSTPVPQVADNTNAPPPTGGGATSSGGALTASSEPTPSYKKPPIDPRPYAWFAKNNPQFKQEIDDAAQLTGVNPLRLAAHKW